MIRVPFYEEIEVVNADHRVGVITDSPRTVVCEHPPLPTQGM